MSRESGRKRILELGCGRAKTPGAIGVDLNREATGADLICDLNDPLPFADSVFDETRAVHVIEHLDDIVRAMSEIHRVTRPGGLAYVVTPHYSDYSSWCDPTHRWHLNSFSFFYFSSLHGQHPWYTRLVLSERRLHVELARIWKWMGIGWAVNHSVKLRRLWEMYLCFIVRGKQMEFTFEIVKQP